MYNPFLWMNKLDRQQNDEAFNVFRIVFRFVSRSLGCLIYVLLTGLSPFFDETTEETCRHIIEVDYSFPTEHFQEVSESAIELIKQLLTKVSSLDSAEEFFEKILLLL